MNRSKVSMALPLVALALAGPAAAAKDDGRNVTVMTRNVFLGADLSPAIGAATIPQAIDGAGVIWNELQRTRFRQRAGPLAREIKRSKADLVGLQEVALWRKQTPSDGGAPPISPCRARPRPPRSSSTSSRSSAGAQARSAPGTGSSWSRGSSTPSCRSTSTASTRPAPAAASFGADFDARLTMRDVILVRKGEQGQARQDPQGPLRDAVRAQRGRRRDPRRPRVGLRRGRIRQARQVAQVPLRRHPPRGVRRRRRSARRRPRS